MKNKKNQETEKLNKNIKDLTAKIERSNSFWFVLLRGLAMGAGTAIGASIIAALLIGILSKTIKTVGDVPILNKIIPGDKIEAIINTNNSGN
jgi:hypothetical protein